MADASVVHIGENSPEFVAFKLFKEILQIESPIDEESVKLDKKLILDTYAECLMTVRSPANRFRVAPPV